MSTVRLGELSIPIIYSQRKTLALHVKQGKPELRAPVGLDTVIAYDFLTERSSWLYKTLNKHQQLASQKKDYFEQSAIPFMGLDIQVTRQLGDKPSFNLTPQGLNCTLTALNDRQGYISLINQFYQAQARFWLTKKTYDMADKLLVRDKLNTVRFRKTKTKWGHCTHDGHIQYNWQIMMAPEPIINYLVAHEVSHLRHLDHSNAFWLTVASIDHDFEQHRTWLRENSHTLDVI